MTVSGALSACGNGQASTGATSSSGPPTLSPSATSESTTTTQSPTVSAEPPAPPSTTSEPPACGSTGAEQAAYEAAEKLPPPFDDPAMSDNYWEPAEADVSGYDPCASLAWIIMPIRGGTGSSPYAIALYHLGEYLGTATAKSYGFLPTVVRVDDATISVTYHWPQGNESNAEASGTSVASFHYDGATESVQMSGEVPPY